MDGEHNCVVRLYDFDPGVWQVGRYSNDPYDKQVYGFASQPSCILRQNISTPSI